VMISPDKFINVGDPILCEGCDGNYWSLHRRPAKDEEKRIDVLYVCLDCGIEDRDTLPFTCQCGSNSWALFRMDNDDGPRIVQVCNICNMIEG